MIFHPKINLTLKVTGVKGPLIIDLITNEIIQEAQQIQPDHRVQIDLLLDQADQADQKVGEIIKNYK